jgi:hypothetical protein
MSGFPTPARMCPSYAAEADASLLGVVNDEGTVDILPKPIPVTADFLRDAARNGASPESRFRFTGTCVNEACRQWQDQGCRIARMAAALNVVPHGPTPLRPCAIRASCRWFTQEGAKACDGCRYVVTDRRGE